MRNTGVKAVKGIVWARSDTCKARKNKLQASKFASTLRPVAHTKLYQSTVGIPSKSNRTVRTGVVKANIPHAKSIGGIRLARTLP